MISKIFDKYLNFIDCNEANLKNAVGGILLPFSCILCGVSINIDIFNLNNFYDFQNPFSLKIRTFYIIINIFLSVLTSMIVFACLIKSYRLIKYLIKK